MALAFVKKVSLLLSQLPNTLRRAQGLANLEVRISKCLKSKRKIHYSVKKAKQSNKGRNMGIFSASIARAGFPVILKMGKKSSGYPNTRRIQVPETFHFYVIYKKP